MTRTLNIIDALSDFGDLPDDVFEYLYDHHREGLNVTWTEDLTPMQVANRYTRRVLSKLLADHCSLENTGKIYRAIQTSAQCWEDNNMPDILRRRKMFSDDHDE